MLYIFAACLENFYTVLLLKNIRKKNSKFFLSESILLYRERKCEKKGNKMFVLFVLYYSSIYWNVANQYKGNTLALQ